MALTMQLEEPGRGTRTTYRTRDRAYEAQDEKKADTLRLFPSPPSSDHPALRSRTPVDKSAAKSRPPNVIHFASFDADELAGMAIMVSEERAANTQKPLTSSKSTHQPGNYRNHSKPLPTARSRPESWSMRPAGSGALMQHLTGSDDDLLGATKPQQNFQSNSSYELADFLRTTAPKQPSRKPSRMDLQGRAAMASQHASHFLKLVHKSSIATSSRKKLGSLLHRKNNDTVTEVQEMLPSLNVKQEVSLSGNKYLALQIPEIEEISQETRGGPEYSHTVTLRDLVLGPMELNSHQHHSKSKRQDDSIGERSVSKHAVSAPTKLLSLLTSEMHQQTLARPSTSAGFHAISTSLPTHSLMHETSSNRDRENRPKTSPTQSSPPRSRRPREFASLSSMVDTEDPTRAADSAEAGAALAAQKPRHRRTGYHVPDVHVKDEQDSARRQKASTTSVHATSAPSAEGDADTVKTSGQSRRRDKSGSLRPAYVSPEIGSLKRSRKRATRERSVRDSDAPDSAISTTPYAGSEQTRPNRELTASHSNAVSVVEISRTHTSRLAIPTSSLERSMKTASMSLPEVCDASGVGICQYERSMAVYELPGNHVPPRLSSAAATKEPTPKTRKKQGTRPPTRIAVNDVKTYTPRPRSAHNAKSAARRRSRASIILPSSHVVRNEPSAPETPVTPPSRALPETPPSRALPDTPPSVKSIGAPSQRRECHKASNSSSSSSSYETIGSREQPAYEYRGLPHIVSQAQRMPIRSKTSHVDARLEALEKQNALLSAALMAVLKTNGALNSAPLPSELLGDFTHPVSSASAASSSAATSQEVGRPVTRHGLSNSAGSAHALDMYMYTRAQ